MEGKALFVLFFLFLFFLILMMGDLPGMISEGALMMGIVIQIILVVSCGLSCLYDNRPSVHTDRLGEAHAHEQDEESGKK